MDSHTKPLRPEEVPLPRAVTTYQRRGQGPIRYRLRERFLDAWTGRRDRRTQSTNEMRSFEWRTPYLEGLWAAGSGAKEKERLTILAAINALHNRCVALGAERAEAERRLTRLEAEIATHLQALRADQLSDRAETGGERYEDPEERRIRRRQTVRREIEAREQECARLRVRTQQLSTEIESERDAIAAYWRVLMVRVAALHAHHHRRASTYARWLSGRRRPALIPQPMERAEWETAACPWLPPGQAA